MNKATCFKITNQSKKDVILYPKSGNYNPEWAIYVRSGCFVFKDFRFMGLDYAIDFDQCYFQFQGGKRKWRVKSIEKQGIEVEIVE